MIVALQYYEEDCERAMALATLLADLEAHPRSDIVLALISQPDTPATPFVERTAEYCRQKFPVLSVASERGAHGYPEACTALWTGAMEWLHTHFVRPEEEAVFTLDGNDTIPLHRNWIDLLDAEHDKTLSQGKLITGTPYWLGGCPLHVNPNAVFQLSILDREPSLLKPPVYDGSLLTHFDIYHRRVMLANASLSSVVHTDWQGAGNTLSVELLKEKAQSSIWLHGYKDRNLYQIARQHFLGDPIPLSLKRYNLGELQLMSSARNRQLTHGLRV